MNPDGKWRLGYWRGMGVLCREVGTLGLGALRARPVNGPLGFRWESLGPDGPIWEEIGP